MLRQAKTPLQAKKQYLPVTVVSDGHLFSDDLHRAGKNETWLHRVLREHDATLESTWLLTVDDKNHVLWLGKEDEK